MYQTKNKFVLFIIAMLYITSCSNDPDAIVLSDKKDLQSFKLEAALNESLNEDIVGTIEDNKIKLNIPQGAVLTKLIPTFTHNGAIVYANDREQTSGVSVINLTISQTYKVQAEDKSFNTYTVEVNSLEDSGKTFASFSFTKEKNPELTEDINLEIKENGTVTGKVPAYTKNLIATFESEAQTITVNGTEQQSGVTSNDFSSTVTYMLTTHYGYKKEIKVSITWESTLPHIYIETEGKQPIVSKDDYLKATVRIDGKKEYSSYDGTTQIKGRGNSTWGYNKKPYRLKLDKKAALLGLGVEKDWVLLANYLDPTLMLNAVAMKTGQLLELPFTNHIVPVDVTINGKYMGNYMFTEQVEISETRVNVDETDGVLLELDTNYDEDWKFKSDNYNLPVMVKDPDVTSDAHMDKIKSNFLLLENAVASADFPNTNYKDYIDINSLVNYLIVYNLTQNMEINHPKSTYMHKNANSNKYFMGPIWDFDWGFDYEGKNVHFTAYDRALFPASGMEPALGRNFFKRFFLDPEFKALYKQKWNDFTATKLPLLYEYLDRYAVSIEISKEADYQIWKYAGKNFKEEVKKLNTWLANRVKYIDNEVKSY